MTVRSGHNTAIRKRAERGDIGGLRCCHRVLGRGVIWFEHKAKAETMSVSSPFPQRKPAEVTAEDCRDYLRTGRCKYGASCKYNHPSNVQTGGGMKMPLDPTEPLFPVRPNEPICQYYMKHGTCKFGQSCKFNHPPQSEMSSSPLNGNSILNGGGRKNDSPQMMWNSAGGESTTQVLPQRPDEPNCIFFLKNGRCKYGSTCRYHHPLNYHDRRPTSSTGEERRQHAPVQQGSNDMHKIHYVTQLPAAYQQGHFVVTDGTLTFLSIDGSTQVIPVSQGSSEGVIYAPSASRPLGHSRDVAASSSTPSIASSYDTAMSNMDMMGSHGESSSSSLWNRPRRNNSSNSLGAFNIADGSGRQHVVQAGRTVYVQNLGDPNVPLPRVGSISSNASENGSVYYDAPQAPGRSGSSTHVQGLGGPTWRAKRSNSFEYNALPSSSYHGREDDQHHDGSGHYRSHENQRSPMVRGRMPQGVRRRQHSGAEEDDGLSMMTSALLTMLDTPEEAAGEHYEGYYDEHSLHSSHMSTPQMRPLEYPIKDNVQSPDTPGDARLYHTNQYSAPAGYYDHATADDRVLGLVRPDSRNRSNAHYQTSDGFQKRQGSTSDDDFLHWHGTGHGGRPLQENAQSLVQTPPSPTSPHAASNVGLYLP